MARAFDDASNQYLEETTSTIASLPFALVCWGNSDDITVGQHPLAIAGDSGPTPEFYVIGFGGGAGGDPVQAAAVGGGDTGVAATSSGYSANTWHHAAAIFVSTTDRRAFIDGGSKGTNATSVTPTLTRASIGASNQAGGYGSFFSGNIAECAIFDLSGYPGATDSDRADNFETNVVPSLAKGYRPILFPGVLAYWPLIGRTSPEIDIVGGFDMTLNNAPTTAAHPPIIYSGLAHQFFAAATAEATAVKDIIGGGIIPYTR